MDRSEIITLIKRTFTKDSKGASHPTETSRTVFCNVKSVGQKEYMDGGRNGLNPQYQFTMFRYDYDDETIVEYAGERYAVYRTFRRTTDTLELYAERKGGTNGKADKKQ